MTTLIPAAILVFLAYRYTQFVSRVSPSIPSAGEESFFDRLKVPVQYGIDPVGFLARQRAKLGDVFSVDLFLLKFVVFLGADGNRSVLRAPEEELSFWDRIKTLLGPGTAEATDFPGWVPASVKVVRPGLVKQERMEDYHRQCDGLAKQYFEKWSQQDSIPLFASLSHCIFAHLFVVLVGEEFLKKYGEELIPVVTMYEKDVQKPILRALPWKLWPLCGPGQRVIHAEKRFDELITVEANEILAHPEAHQDRSDYLYLVVTTLGAQYVPVYGNHIMTMIFGGHANAAMTIPWMFLHARRLPGALDRWREEILSEDSGDKRPFLEACLRETGRLYTNTTILRQTRTVTKVGGHQIPAGMTVASSPAATHRDPTIYKDPEAWRPERFLEDGSYSEWFQKNQFVQFGLGQHACPGEKLAKMMIFDLVLRTWAESYDIQVVSGLQEGKKGLDGVGAEGAWTEENFGTPSIRGEDVMVRIIKRVSA